MQEKILVAFDDSENAMRAVEFIAKRFRPQYDVTLFHVQPDISTICNLTNPSLTPYFLAQQASFCSMEEKQKELLEQAMERARQQLLDAGFAEDLLHKKVQIRQKGIARDIADEVASGYDMLVMGRRGLSAIKEFLMGSVTQKVMSLVKNKSIVLVD